MGFNTTFGLGSFKAERLLFYIKLFDALVSGCFPSLASVKELESSVSAIKLSFDKPIISFFTI
jgi:hypothetical protein